MNNVEIIKEAVSTYDLLDMLGIELYKDKIICPFHNDNSPSMWVYDDHFHCFSCGNHHDVISFTKKYLNLNFKETIQMLASKKNINITLSDTSSFKYYQELKEIRRYIRLTEEASVEYCKQMIDIYNDYLDMNKQYGYLDEEYNQNRSENENVWMQLSVQKHIAIIHYAEFFKMLEEILKNNWELPNFNEILKKNINTKLFSNELKQLINITEF